MSNRKKGRVDNKMAIVIIATALVLALGIVLVLVGEKPESAPKENKPQASVPGETIDLSTLPEGTIPVVIEEQAPYEYWLLANMVSVLTLEYPDFQELELFISGETELTNRMESQGAWVRFVSGGQTVVIQSQPLEAERSEKGTRDIHSTQAQYSTFDVVEGVDLSAMTGLTLEDIAQQLINISLPKIIQH